jgi:hypothetical protein
MIDCRTFTTKPGNSPIFEKESGDKESDGPELLTDSNEAT